MTHIKEYISAKNQIAPDELSKYEDGNWAATEKKDGCWACLKTDDNGIVYEIAGQSGTDFNPKAIEGIKGRAIGLPNSTIIGELETGSQAATKLYRLHGYRRFHIFDLFAVKNEYVGILTYDLRRKLIEAINKEIFSKDPETAKRLLVVRQQNKDFKNFYDDVMDDGGEGMVLKKLNGLYQFTCGINGKTDNWIKVKEHRFEDYYVMDHKLSKKGFDQLEIGYWNNGQPKRVQTILCPKGFKPNDLVGKVIEVKGGEMMDSGAIRHGRFHRIREDR